MNEMKDQDLDIKEALNMSLVTEEPSQELLRELRVMASNVTPSKRPWWQPGLAIAGAAAVTVGVVTLTMTPSKATAHTFDSLMAAAAQVNAFQFNVNAHENGHETKVDIQGSNGRFSIKTDEGALMEFNKGVMKIYDPKENTLTELSVGTMFNPDMIANAVQTGISEGMKELDLKKKLKEYEQKYGKDHIQISPVTTENGHQVYHVTMEAPDEPSVVKMLVDATTDLPEKIQVKGKNGSDEDTDVEMRFGGPERGENIPMQFPKNAKKVTIDLGAMIGDAMKEMGGNMKDSDKNFKGPESMKGLENLGPLIEKAMKEGMKENMKDSKGHVNFNFDSKKGD